MPTLVLDPDNPLHLIPATLQTNPDAIAVLPVFTPAHPDQTLIRKTRKRLKPIPPDIAKQLAQHEGTNAGNGNQPVELPTHIEVGDLLLMIPSDLADNLRGPMSTRDLVYLFIVRREVYDAAMRQAQTGIIPATQMPQGPVPGSGSRIIKS